jgi:outer membrane lipoprotein-sorting protein
LKIGLTILLCLGVVTVGFSQTHDGGSLTPQAIARKSLDTYAALTSYSDIGTTIEVKDGRTNITTFSLRMQRPNLFKVHWVQPHGNQTNQGTWWANGHTNFTADDSYIMTNTVGQPTNDQPKTISSRFGMDRVSEASGHATAIPDIFFKLSIWPENILESLAAGSITNSAKRHLRLSDGKVGDVDCHLITITTDALTRPPYPLPEPKKVYQVWIGKHDWLLHQVQATTAGPDLALTQIHENISVNQPYSAADFQEEILQKAEEEHSSSITLSSLPPATNSDSGQTNDTGPKHKARKRQKN